MRIAIVDDSDLDAQSLMRYVEAYRGERGCELEAERFSGAAEFMKSRTSAFSLAIMDIDMPGLTGMEASHLLRSIDPAIQIMFVTSMPQYALESYEVDAVDYLLKPVSYATFALKLTKALRRVEGARESSILLKTSDGTLSLSPAELTYVESQGHYLVYHTQAGPVRTRETMSAAERRLGPLGFARCNSYYLVGMRHVSLVTATDVTVGGEVLRMSRSRRREFMDAFSRFTEGGYQ